MKKIRVSHLVVATFDIASFASVSNTTSSRLAKAIFSFTYMKHQCIAMILIQRRVKSDVSFQAVERRRRLTILASSRKDCRKSMTIMRETKISDVSDKVESFEKSIHRKISYMSKLRYIRPEWLFKYICFRTFNLNQTNRNRTCLIWAARSSDCVIHLRTLFLKTFAMSL